MAADGLTFEISRVCQHDGGRGRAGGQRKWRNTRCSGASSHSSSLEGTVRKLLVLDHHHLSSSFFFFFSLFFSFFCISGFFSLSFILGSLFSFIPVVFFSFSYFCFPFLDAFSHLYKRVYPSVGPSVRRSVTHELNFWEMGQIWTK